MSEGEPPQIGQGGPPGGRLPHHNDPPGAEYTINLAVVCLIFFLLGPGAVSLDALLF